MQANAEHVDPTVRIRDVQKDRVNFVLENVDLAYAGLPTQSESAVPVQSLMGMIRQICELVTARHDGGYSNRR